MSAARTAWAGLVLVLAATALVPAFTGSVLGVPVVVVASAAAVAVVLGGVALARRAGVHAGVVAAVGVLLTTTAATLVLRSRQAVAGEADLPVAAWRDSPGLSLLGPLVDSVPRLLSASRPAPAEPVLLTPVVALVALVALVVGLLVQRRGPGAAVSPLGGGSVLYLAGALLTAGEGDRNGVLAAVLVLAAAGGWVLLRPGARTGTPPAARTRLRTAVVALAPVLAVAAVATAAGAVADPDPFEPRDLVARPTLPVQLVSPLPQLAVWGDETDELLMTVSGQHPERLRLVALPDYDGAAWSLSARLAELGAPGGPDLPAGAETGVLDLRVSTAPGLDVDWLPAAGLPSAVGGLPEQDVALDPDTGTLVHLGGAAPVTYRVTGLVDTPSAAALAGAGVPSGPEVERYLEVPGRAAALREYAVSGTGRATTRLEQAAALEELVRNGRTLDATVDSGSALFRLEQFLFGAPGTPGAQVGGSEQFAASFVLLARSVGLPSRLVVGVEVPPAAPDGTARVTSADAQAWPEVYFSGSGWVAFDPTPTVDGGPGDGPGDAALEALTAPEATDPTSGDTVGDGPLATAVPSAADPGPSVLSVVLGVAAVLGVLLLVALAVLLLARTRRRRRLRRAGAAGAWQQVVDALVLAGRPPGAGVPAPEIARRAGGPAVLALAHAAERAAYAPGPATTPTRAEPWPVAVAAGRELRRGARTGRRVVWAVSPAPLRTGTRSRARNRTTPPRR